MRVSFSPHPHQCFLSLVFVTIAILTGVRWHLIVVLICISPVISYVDYLFLCWPSVCFHMCCFIPCSQQVFVIGTLVCAKSLQLYPTVCNPMDCSLLGSFVHGILQVRVLEWIAISFSRASSWPRDRIRVSCIGRRVLYHWATRKVPLITLSRSHFKGKQQDCSTSINSQTCLELHMYIKAKAPSFDSNWFPPSTNMNHLQIR